jgi:hypothetical protein
MKILYDPRLAPPWSLEVLCGCRCKFVVKAMDIRRGTGYETGGERFATAVVQCPVCQHIKQITPPKDLKLETLLPV